MKATSWLGAGDEHGANRKVVFELLFVIFGNEGIVNHGRVWDVDFVVTDTPSLISRANHARGVLRVPNFLCGRHVSNAFSGPAARDDWFFC